MSDCYGMKNVVLKNINNAITAGRITTQEQLEQVFIQLENLIESSKDKLHERIGKIHTCEHEFFRATFTVQRMISGYTTIYERKCKKCGFGEYHSEGENGAPNPEWTEGAEQRWWNNDI